MQLFKKKIKYQFNIETLQYEKESATSKKIWKKIFKHSFLAIGTGIIVIILYTFLYPLYIESNMKRENTFLKKQISSIKNELSSLNQQLDTLAKNDNNIYRTLLGKDTIPLMIRNAGTGGQNKYKEYEEFSSSHFILEARNKIEKIKNKIDIQAKSQDEIFSVLMENKEYFRCAPLLEPIHVNKITSFSSNFGYRPHPILGILQFHKGIDITAPQGTAIIASGDGEVSFAGNRNDGYGYSVVIDHKVRGLSSRYAHLSKIDIKRGQKVVRGEKIGEVGNTGLSTAPHLHFEILKNENAVNPLRYIFMPNAESYEILINNARHKMYSLD